MDPSNTCPQCGTVTYCEDSLCADCEWEAENGMPMDRERDPDGYMPDDEWPCLPGVDEVPV